MYRHCGLCTSVCAAHPGLLDACWPPFCAVQSALAALSEPIWAPRWPSELQLALCTAKMSSNLPFSCPSRALKTFKKCGRVVKIRGSGFFAVEVLLDCNFAALWAFLDASWAQLGPLVRLLGTTWSLLGPTWSLLDASWAQLGASWAPLGSNLEPLDASWAQLGAYWAALGPNLEPLGCLLGSTWRSWTPLGPNLKPLGRLLDASWAPL